jgi:hypothetical protein
MAGAKLAMVVKMHVSLFQMSLQLGPQSDSASIVAALARRRLMAC